MNSCCYELLLHSEDLLLHSKVLILHLNDVVTLQLPNIVVVVLKDRC